MSYDAKRMSDVDAMREWAQNQWIARYTPPDAANVAAMDEYYPRLRAFRDQFAADAKQKGMSRPEISRGMITATLAPSTVHRNVRGKIADQLDAQAPEGYAAHREVAVEAPELGLYRVPDVIVVEEAHAQACHGPVDPAKVLRVVEITEPHTTERDLGEKRADYAAMGIPAYLTVDCETGQATQFEGLHPVSDVPTYLTELRTPENVADSVLHALDQARAERNAPLEPPEIDFGGDAASTVTITDIPDDTMRVLLDRAKTRGQSLEAYVRDLLEHHAAEPDAWQPEKTHERRLTDLEAWAYRVQKLLERLR